MTTERESLNAARTYHALAPARRGAGGGDETVTDNVMTPPRCKCGGRSWHYDIEEIEVDAA